MSQPYILRDYSEWSQRGSLLLLRAYHLQATELSLQDSVMPWRDLLLRPAYG